MHEVSLMQQTIGIVLDYAVRAHAHSVTKVRMRVGEDSGALPTALTFAFGVVTQGTIASDACLEIESVPVVCHCGRCDKEFVPPGMVYECPTCGAVTADVRKGRELQVVAIEVEE